MIEVLRSLISPHSISSQVIQDYNLLGELDCKLLKFGGSNDIYHIFSKANSYVVKLYNKRECWPYSKNHYLFENKLQEFLVKQNVKVPLPLYNIQGHLISIINAPEYEKFYALFNYLSGEAVEYNNINDATSYKVGKYLAKFHQISQNFTIDFPHQRILDINFLLLEPYKRIKKFIIDYGFSSQFSAHIDKLYRELLTDLDSIHLHELSFGIIHGDTHPGNFFINNNDITMIDFELSGSGYLIYDLATFRWKYKVELQQSESVEFIRGYIEENPTMIAQLPLIDLFVRLRHFFILGSTIITYHDNPELLKEKILLKYLDALQPQ